MEIASTLDRALCTRGGSRSRAGSDDECQARFGERDTDASRLSVVRTVVICLLALILGFGGSRLKRVELLWVAYVAIAFGTLKLVFEDLRFGNTASLVASLLSYGLILILIPRLTRQKIETLDRPRLRR